MDLTFNSRMEEYYQRFIDLQDKLRKSEEERLKLEIKFNELLQVSREEEQAHYKKLRSQYKRFLDEDRKRQERNEKILRTLERIEARVNALMSKSERFKLLRRQYQNYLNRLSHIADPEKLRDRKVDLQSDRTTPYEHPSVQKALQKSNDEKLELLDKYLHSLQSQKVDNGFCFEKESTDLESSKDLQLLEAISDRLNRNFDSNKATSIAEEIMNSIYSRHYKKGTENDNVVKSDKVNGAYDSDDDDYVPRNVEESSKNTHDNSKPGSVLEHLLNRNANLTTHKNPILNKPLILKTFNETDKNLNKAPSEPQTPVNAYQNMTLGIVPTINSGDEYQHEQQINQSDIKTGLYNPIEDSRIQEPNQQLIQSPLHKSNTEDIIKLNSPSDNLENSVKSIELNRTPVSISPTAPQDKDTTQSVFNDQPRNISGTFEESSQKLDKQLCKETNQASYSEHTEGYKQSTIEEPVEFNTQPHAENDYSSKPTEHSPSIQQPVDLKNPQQYVDEQQYDTSHPVRNYEEAMQPVESNDHTIQQYGDYESTTEQYNEMGQEYQENTQPSQQYSEHGQPVQYQEENVSQHYDENGHQLQYQQQYDENDQPIQQYDENGQPIQQYDENGQPIQQYDENGQPIHQYDENGQPIHQYDGNGQPIHQYDENGQAIQQYDENGQPIQQYDENGQPIQQYNENSQPIHQYDENGQPVQQYNESEQPVQQYDENGQLIQQYNYQYDENSQLQYQQQYDEHGQPIQQYDENGQLILPYQPQYDENGQLIQQFDEQGQPIHSYQQQYDENGQPIPQQYDEHGQIRESHYDQQQFDENGQPIQQQQYDENGQPIQTYDESGQIYQNYEQVDQQYVENEQQQQQQLQSDHIGEEVLSAQQHSVGNADEEKIENKEPAGKKNVLDILDTDTESMKQNTSKISNDSDFDFSNG